MLCPARILCDAFFFVMGDFLKIYNYLILTNQRQYMTELKLVWPVIMTGDRSENNFKPCILFQNFIIGTRLILSVHSLDQFSVKSRFHTNVKTTIDEKCVA